MIAMLVVILVASVAAASGEFHFTSIHLAELLIWIRQAGRVPCDELVLLSKTNTHTHTHKTKLADQLSAACSLESPKSLLPSRWASPRLVSPMSVF